MLRGASPCFNADQLRRGLFRLTSYHRLCQHHRHDPLGLPLTSSPKDLLPWGSILPPIGGGQGWPWPTWPGNLPSPSPETTRNIAVGTAAGAAVGGAAWYVWVLAGAAAL
jgi:hypothetical protein